jgi:hypothetical protein
VGLARDSGEVAQQDEECGPDNGLGHPHLSAVGLKQGHIPDYLSHCMLIELIWYFTKRASGGVAVVPPPATGGFGNLSGNLKISR